MGGKFAWPAQRVSFSVLVDDTTSIDRKPYLAPTPRAVTEENEIIGLGEKKAVLWIWLSVPVCSAIKGRNVNQRIG